jgi:hypothetical protein
VQKLDRDYEDKRFIFLGDFNDNPDNKSLNILETGDIDAQGGLKRTRVPSLKIPQSIWSSWTTSRFVDLPTTWRAPRVSERGKQRCDIPHRRSAERTRPSAVFFRTNLSSLRRILNGRTYDEDATVTLLAFEYHKQERGRGRWILRARRDEDSSVFDEAGNSEKRHERSST